VILRAGYSIPYEFPQPTPLILMLNVHFSRVSDLAVPDHILLNPSVPLSGYRDGFGNWCTRLLAPAGLFSITSDFSVRDRGLPDPPPKAGWQVGVQHLPDDALVFLLASRFCDSDRLLDLAWEDYRVNVLAEEPRGSTGRGITPAYLDEVGQQQITYADFLAGPNYFARKLAQRADRAIRTIQHVCRVAPEKFSSFFDTLTVAETRANTEAIEAGVFTKAEFDFTQFRGTEPFTLNLARLTEIYWTAGTALAKNIGEVRELILREVAAGRTVIGEFGQAYWLDKRHGYSPNVTASHTYTPEFFESAGIPVQRIHTFGVAKAYDTKVGTHTFLTHMDDAAPLTIKLKQLEFGTSTGRQRMVGWYDAVEKGDVLRYGGYQDLMINKIDALSGADELLICTAYEDASGRRFNHVPRNEAIRRALKPVYSKHPGWSEDICGVRQFTDLPKNAQRYTAAMVRSLIEVAYPGKLPAVLPNLRYLGVGPLPSQIIKDVPATAELIKLG